MLIDERKRPFWRPGKLRRLSIVDGNGEQICHCQSEEIRDRIFELIMNHGAGSLQVGDVVQLKNGDELVANGVHYKKAVVVSIQPLVLVSHCAVARWEYDGVCGLFVPVDRASKSELVKCFRRLCK